MDYPSWAPADLVALHKERNRETANPWPEASEAMHRSLSLIAKMGRGLFDCPAGRYDPLKPMHRLTRTHLLDHFIFCDDAKKLWEVLNRTDVFKAGGTAYGYWKICEEVLSDWEDDPKHTCAEKENELSRIASKARELAELISKSSYMRGSKLVDLRAFEDSAVPALTDEEIADGIIRAPAITKNNEEAAILHGLRRLHRMDERMPEHEAHTASLLAQYSYMRVSEVVRQIAAIADEENQYGPMVSRPHSAHAKRQFIARHLNDIHMVVFGSPMWDAHALACTLILDPNEPLTPDDLRPYCR